MTALETYLRELRDIRSSGAGVKETSFYPALSNLLNNPRLEVEGFGASNFVLFCS